MKDEDIFNILDGIASEETIRQHHKKLSESADYQILFKEYAHTHALLADTAVEKTTFNFTDKLMDKWELSQEMVMVRQSSKLPIYFLIGMSILVVLLIISVLPMMTAPSIQIDLSKPLSILQDKLFTRFFLVINALVALFFIDKKILKPYFERRIGM
jgi:competence protein ComGC